MFELNLDYVASSDADKIVRTLRKYYRMISDRLAGNVQDRSDKMTKKDLDYYSYILNRLENELNVAIEVEKLENGVIDYSKIEKAIALSKELEMPVNFYVVGGSKIRPKENVDMLFTKKTLNNLIEVNNKLVQSGENGLLFMEDQLHPERCWDFQDVIFANAKIDKIVRYIKRKQFSPFEALTYIHQYIASKFKYKEDPKNLINSRSIVGCLNSDKIVCAGYAKLVKAIIDKLHMPGLECTVLNSLLYQPDGTEITKNEEGKDEFEFNFSNMSAHAQDLVKINDPKYKIHGKYVTDACWDSAPSPLGGDKRSIATLLFPVEDLNNLAQFIFYHPRKQDVYNYLVVSSPENMGPIMANTTKFFNKNVIKSTLIDIDTYKKCLANVYSKINPKLKEEEVDAVVNEIMDNTMFSSYATFNENSVGKIAQKAQELYSIEEDNFNEDLFRELERLFAGMIKGSNAVQTKDEQPAVEGEQEKKVASDNQDAIDNVDEEMEKLYEDENLEEEDPAYNFIEGSHITLIR